MSAADLVTKPINFSALRERIDQRLAEHGHIT